MIHPSSISFSPGLQYALPGPSKTHGKNHTTSAKITEVATERLRTKRKRDDFELNEQPPAKRAKKIRPIKHEDALFECTRDDALVLGVEMRSKYILEKLAELSSDEKKVLGWEDEEEIVEKKRLDKDTKIISEISETQSPRVGSQISTLFDICKSESRKHNQAVRKIKDFALEIVEQLPKSDPMPDIPEEEIEEEFMTLAQSVGDNSQFKFSKEQVVQLAAKLQSANQVLQQDEMDTDHDNVDEEAENHVIKILGHLLLIARDDIEAAAACITDESQDASIERLADCVKNKIEAAKAKAEKKAIAHADTGLQDADEAHYRAFTLGMAELMLHEDHGINFGIIDDLVEIMIPEKFKNIAAVKNLGFILEKLKTSPLCWLKIAQMEKPASPDLPSNDLIRASLGLKGSDQITDYHAQLTALSAIMDHFRQANAGTCFATAWLIKIMNNDLESCLEDFKDLLQNSNIVRSLTREYRTFPFQIIMTKEGLDTVLSIDPHGRILSVENPYKTQEESTQEHSSYLYAAPGIIAACRILNIEDVKMEILDIIPFFNGKPFAIKELLTELAKVAYQISGTRINRRSIPQFTLEELTKKAFYAFGAETNNPLHRAWEQVSTQLVNYFGSQYTMPRWTFEGLEKTLTNAIPTHNHELRRMYRAVIPQLCLPLITRMRYRYNHNFDDSFMIFGDRPYSVENEHYYGYELCDTDLPNDFEYDTTLYKQYKNKSRTFNLYPFNEYAPPNEWKLINTEEKFREFIADVIKKTIAHIIEQDPKKAKKWGQVQELLLKKVSANTFTKRMIENLGNKKHQRQELRKNPYTVATTPWLFKWGGWPDEVVLSYYNFHEHPVKNISFSGTPKEVLALHINYLKKQSDEIKEQFKDPSYLTPVCSPCHAFNLKPAEPSFQKACSSELSTNDYIRKFVEKPGLKVANRVLTKRTRQTLIDFVANNMWYSKSDEKHDLDRQELTEISQLAFDKEILKIPLNLSVKDFCDCLENVVFISRAADTRIAKRFRHWEQKFKVALKNKVKDMKLRSRALINENEEQELINFARNRKDVVALSKEAASKFREAMAFVPANLSIYQFRTNLAKKAAEAHYGEIFFKDTSWIKSLTPRIDSKIFSLLSITDKQKLLDSAIITHDTNWKDSVNDVHFAFLVNPGSGKIELCNYYPDTKKIAFRNLEQWFAKSRDSRWELPDNYRAFSSGPIFNTHELMEV